MTTDINIKHALSSQFARIGKALSNANRLEIIEYLAQGERSVDSLARVAGLSTANTSQHLQQLRQAGLVETRKEGLRVFYRLSGEDVIDLLNAMRGVANRHLADVPGIIKSYLSTRDELEPVPATELLRRMQRGEVTLLDMRPPEEYAAGHLPGAINVQLDELAASSRKLKKEREVIAYCRGPYCVLSYDAVALLRKRGFRARRLIDGFPEWQRAGHAVERQLPAEQA